MDDHVWLLKLDKIFSGYKYILRVAPSTSGPQYDNRIEEQVAEIGRNISKQVSNQGSRILKRVNIVDTNTRFQLTHSHGAIEHIIFKMKEIGK
jgi:hypothetical protein